MGQAWPAARQGRAKAEVTSEAGSRPSRHVALPGKGNHLPALWMLLAAVGTVWFVAYMIRVSSGQPNIDDYLYARQSADLTRSGLVGYARGTLHSGTWGPLVLALAAPLARLGGVEAAVVVQLPLYLLLAVGAYLLVLRWLAPLPAAMVAVVATLNQAVLGWSVMLHFGVASSACVVWSFVAYFRSDRLSRPIWSAGLGMAVALLSLSRTISLVYVVPLLLVLAFDLVRDRTRRQEMLAGPVALAALVAVMVAGPWWFKSGGTAWEYLRSAGYETTSGFTDRGFSLTLADVWARVTWTLADMGLVQGVAMGVATVVALVLGRRVQLQGQGLIIAWILLTTAVLSTSANQGTGFGLPVLVVLLLVVGATIAATVGNRRTAVLALALVGVGVVVQQAGGWSGWFAPTPYRMAVLASGGDAATDVDEIHRRAVELLGREEMVVIARDDGLLNAQGLLWHGARIIIPPYGEGGTDEAVAALPNMGGVITGDSPTSYHATLDRTLLEREARDAGFTLVATWELGDENTVRFWRR